MATSARKAAFADRVVIVFVTQVFGAAVGVVNGLLIARLLGPAAKGDYYLLVLVPSTAMVLIQLGLPQAFGFFAARGRLDGLVGKTVVLTVLLSLIAVVGVVVVLPVLQADIFHGIALPLILVAFLSLPLALNATLTTGVVLGRQAVRWYALINSAYPLATTVLVIALLGYAGLGIGGALAIYLIASLIQTGGFLIAAARLHGDPDAAGGAVSYRDLFGYGLPFYPGSITIFFSYRADVFLLAWLLGTGAAAPLGYYSLAVSFAELVFFFPNAVETLFFPHVAAATRDDADRQVAVVTRVTLLLTGLVGLALVPASIVLIDLLLPAFQPSLPALFVLLPGVVALTATKVITGYTTGLGMTSLTSNINVGAFMLNVVVNLLLIPGFGIEGAAAASLVSYTASSVAFSLVAAQASHARVVDFWLPRASDLTLVVQRSAALLRRVFAAVRPGRVGSVEAP